MTDIKKKASTNNLPLTLDDSHLFGGFMEELLGNEATTFGKAQGKDRSKGGLSKTSPKVQKQ